MEEPNRVGDCQSLQNQFAELQERAAKDALSGLLNRETAEQYIKQRLEEMRPQDSCAMFIVDLDDFKNVNDTLGHQAGDRAIRRAAQILSGLFRANDIVGRLGGDEFVVFLSGEVTEALVRKKGDAICKNLQLVLGGNPSVSLTASVGIHLASGNGQPFEGLYQSADLALYRVKKGGKHGFCLKSGDALDGSGARFLPVNTISLGGLLENMDSGVALVSVGEELRVLYVSPSFCRMIGVDPQGYALPKPLAGVVHPDDYVAWERTLRSGVEQGSPVSHLHRVSGDGKRWSWWHVRAVRIEYDHPDPVVMVTTTDVSQYKENEDRLQEINERLQTAFDQTARSLWEVDLSNRSFRLFGSGGRLRQHGSEPMRFPEELISAEWVHPDSAPRFREFAESLLNGHMQGYGNFIVQYQDTGCYGWAALSYRTLLDDAGRAVKAVGIVETLPQRFAGEDGVLLNRPLPEAFVPDLVVSLRANLTRDAMLSFWCEGKSMDGAVRDQKASDALCRGMERIFHKEDRDALAPYFNRESLLRLFEQGERWLSAEYRRADGSGSIEWVMMVANLVADPLTRDVYLFAYVNKTERRRRLEAALDEPPAWDFVTRFYKENTAIKMVKNLLKTPGAGLCGVAALQVGGLEKLQNEGGMTDRQRRNLALALSVALGGNCVVGMLEFELVFVFFPKVGSREEMRSLLDRAFSFVRVALGNDVPLGTLRFLAGAVCEKAANARFPEMLEQARAVCRELRGAEADTVEVAGENGGLNGMRAGMEDGRVTVHSTEMQRPLSEGEKDVAFQCVTAMLAANSLKASLESVLAYIGGYYRADRVYVLLYDAGKRTVTMPYEWATKGKHSILRAVSNVSVEQFPLVKRCIEERAPVFLSKKGIETGQNGENPTGWHFTIFPLIEHEELEGFLCIENSKVHPADAALFSVLIPYILRERERFHGQDAWEELPGPRPADLPNLRAYMGVINQLTSSRYSSLGAVCLDVPNLATINSSLGFSYGGQLLWYVAKTLADIFGLSLLFRTWEAEFVAFCPNTTREVFQAHCSRLRVALRRRYPQEVRIGFMWSDGVFQGKELVNEARALMRGEGPLPALAAKPAEPPEGDYQSVKDAAQAGRFTVFFQPKVDMNTGRLYGVEALARGVDNKGGIIPPARFIGELEKSGGIRDLDFFVLDRALSLVNKWKQAGYGVVKVSVNLSRVTLFHPATLGSVLAIQSHYPDLPPDALELEITESVGNVASADLQRIINRFRQTGVKFSLDDFGSQYANIPLFTNVKFDTVKLDRSLVAELASNPINRMLIENIIHICQVSGMDCVAEGVETKEQITALTGIGCSYAQGYYFDRPLPADQFEQKYLWGKETEAPQGGLQLE